MALLATLGLRPPARLAGDAATAAPSGMNVNAAASPRGKAKAKDRDEAKGELELGGAQIVEMSLGTPVPGPRIGELMALMAADGSGALNRGNSAVGGQINRDGAALHQSFGALTATEKRWRQRYDAVQKMAAQSAEDIKKMDQERQAVGGRSRNRPGDNVRGKSESYVKADRAVKDRMRAIGVAEEGLRKSVHAVHAVALKQSKLGQERKVKEAQGEVEAEEKRIAARKSALGTVFDIGLKVLKQDWGSLAEDAAKYVIDEAFDSIPTVRLDQLKQELEQATTQLKQLEDEVLMAEYETQSAGMREASLKLEDARQDLIDAVADLALARKTAIESLGESRSTQGAARMIERRGKMLELMRLTREAIRQYLGGSPAVGTAIRKLDSMTSSYPAIVRKTPGVDPDGEYARALAATVARNREALAVWSLYVQHEENSCRTALELLDRKGPGSFVEHFDRVGEMLQQALVDR